MRYFQVNNIPVVKIELKVVRGKTDKVEDFSRAKVYFWLTCRDNRYPISVTAEDGIISAFIPSNLKQGVYDIKAVWTKDQEYPNPAERYLTGNHRHYELNEHSDKTCRSEVDALFAIVDSADHISENGTIQITSEVATYGYDGLDAYELSVMRGKTLLDENAWLNRLNNNTGSNTSVSRTEWVYKLAVAKTTVSPNGEDILITNAERTCTEITKVDGDVVSEEPVTEWLTLSAIGTGASIKTVDGKKYISIPENTSRKDIVYYLKGSIGGEVLRTLTLTQSSAPTVYILSVKDATPDETTRRFVDMGNGTFEVDCYDADININLGVTGDVGTITATKVNGDFIYDCSIDDNVINVVTSNNGTMVERYGTIRIDTSKGKTYYINITQKYDANASDNWVDLDS